MVGSTYSVDRPPSPDLSSLILEDYSQKLGCSPPMSSAFHFDQKWVLNMEGSPVSNKNGFHKSDDPKIVSSKDGPNIGCMDEAGVTCVFGMDNDPGSCIPGSFEVESNNGAEKSVSLSQGVTGGAQADSVHSCWDVGPLAYSHTAPFDAEAKDKVVVRKESLTTETSEDLDEDCKGVASGVATANLVSNDAQESEVLYTCVAALVGEKTGVKEEPLDANSTDAEEDSEAGSDSDIGTSESDSSSSSSDDDSDDENDKDSDVEPGDENVEVKDNEDMEGEIKTNNLGKMVECAVKSDGNECKDKETDGFEFEDVNISSEDEVEKEAKGPIKSKNELEVLPPVPSVDVILLPHHQTLPVGVVSSIVGYRVIVDGNIKHNPLNEGSVLWITESRTPLGFVDEIFGPVKNPYYIVRYTSAEDIPMEIHIGMSVSAVAEFSTVILNQTELYKKGYDASGENDEELDEVEFSDDEKEAEYRRSLRQSKREMDDKSHGNWDRKKNQHRRDGVQKQMRQEAHRKPKEAMPGPSNSVQQRVPSTNDSNFVNGAQTPTKFLGSGSVTSQTVSLSVHSDASLGAQSNLLSPPNSSWNPVPPPPLQNMVASGNLMVNGILAPPASSVMQGAIGPFLPPQQQAAGFLGGVMTNTLTCQPMLPLHMQNMGPSGGLLTSTTPFQFQPQQLVLLQNQQQALLQQQQQQRQLQLSMSQFSYGFPTQPQFIPNQALNIFPLNGQMNPSLGSPCFDPVTHSAPIQAPFHFGNTSISAANMNNIEQGNRNPSSSREGSECSPTQFHMGASSVRGRGAPFPRAKRPFGKRRP